jgi:hypothetical protein
MFTTDGEMEPVVPFTTLPELPWLLTQKENKQKDTKGMRCTCENTRILQFLDLPHGSKVQGNVSDSSFQ